MDWDPFESMTNRKLYELYVGCGGGRKRLLLTEMARRMGTYDTMQGERYRTDDEYAASVDAETVRMFEQYKLSGGQEDRRD